MNDQQPTRQKFLERVEKELDDEFGYDFWNNPQGNQGAYKSLTFLRSKLTELAELCLEVLPENPDNIDLINGGKYLNETFAAGYARGVLQARAKLREVLEVEGFEVDKP